MKIKVIMIVTLASVAGLLITNTIINAKETDMKTCPAKGTLTGQDVAKILDQAEKKAGEQRSLLRVDKNGKDTVTGGKVAYTR